MINNVSPANCEDPLDLYCSGVDSKLQKLNKKTVYTFNVVKP